MPIDHKLIRIEAPDDPERCRSVGAHQQCPYKRAPGREYCYRHGYNGAEAAEERENIRNYRLAKWKARLEEFADNPQVKSLREEIGILRILLEETLNKCNDVHDLLLQTNRISDLVVKIDKVVNSAHRLEQTTGQLLDRTAALNFAMQVVTVITCHVKDPDILDKVTEDIMKQLNSKELIHES